jgi:hypothetical protein
MYASDFILVLFSFVYAAVVTHVLSTADAIIATQAPAGACESSTRPFLSHNAARWAQAA